VGEAHLGLLREMLDLLERYAKTVSRADLDRDREAWVKVKGSLEVAAQCVIDAALDLISRRGLGTPQTYREAFAVLARANLIDAPLLDELQAWAGLRNVLVHMYTKLDLDRVHAALAKTASLRAFHAIVSKELRKSPDAGRP
jgi:uncharacterized protein YutE (UPF0331/DUF86 family)